MFIKTVSTTSGINPIKFDETGGVFYWILNTGLSTLYASTKSAFTAGDDGVASLGPKESRRLETNNDTIYILGEGQVEIHNQRDGICSFKQAPTSSGGGGTVDAYTKTESDAKYAAKSDVPDAYTKTESDAKYAQKTDIPTSLPANGGNADTVGGVGIANLRQITQTVIHTLPAVPNGEGDFLVNCDLSDTSFPYWYGHLSIRYGSYTGEYVATFRTTGNDNKVYYNTYLTNHWNGWINVADGGKANSADTLTDWGTRTVTDANDAPFGFCAALNCENAPNTFWSTILTTGSSAATNYKTQIAFPWAFGLNEDRIRYRCENNGEWGSWQEIYTSYNKPYVTGTFTVNASDTEQTISVPLTFNPSVVLLFTRQITLTVPKQIILIALSGTEYKIKIGVPNSGDLSALSTGFEAIINSWKGIASTIDYIAYK